MEEKTEVNAVAVKLPPFWCETPHFWFVQAETQFALNNITSDCTKFHHVIAAINQEMVKYVMDLLHYWLHQPRRSISR